MTKKYQQFKIFVQGVEGQTEYYADILINALGESGHVPKLSVWTVSTTPGSEETIIEMFCENLPNSERIEGNELEGWDNKQC